MRIKAAVIGLLLNFLTSEF